MYRINTATQLSDNVFKFEIEAPLIARKTEPGQFIVLRVDEQGERIPLTVADFDRERGLVTIIFQVAGASTQLLSQKKAGDFIQDFVGPLGRKSEIKPGIGTVVCIGGGIGTAPVYPIARAMRAAGNKVISIIGARSRGILIMEQEMKAVSDELIVTTDDGSYGMKGFVTTALSQLVDRGEKPAVVYAIGPVIMMRSVVELTRKMGIKTIVSLNPVMVDGTGMCGCCRVKVNNEIKFACVDGPEFDGHLVDFKNLMSRQGMFREQEQEAKDHVCRIGLGRN